MEPISITAMVSGTVSFIVNRLSKNKSFDELFNKLTTNSVQWLKSKLFQRDGSLKKEIEELKNNPKSKARIKQLEGSIEGDIEDDPEISKYLSELIEKMKETVDGADIVNQIINSKNVNIGDATAGGNINIGDSGLGK